MSAASGNCLCGAVAFTVAPPYAWFAYCHCSLCRKQHGTLFGTSLGVARGALQFLRGMDAIVSYRSTPAFERPFCRHCGAAVPAASHDERYWHVPAGLLDDGFTLKPRSQIFVASRSPLTELDETVPQHAAYPPGAAFPPAVAPRTHAAAAVAGSCLCGGVSFTSDELPRRVVNCYCSLCRRSRAAAFSSTLAVPAEAFRFLTGAARIARYTLQAPRRYAVHFCADCGSSVPSVEPGDARVMLPAGAIDTRLPQLPAVHLCVRSKAQWYDIPGSAPQFDDLPPPERLAEILS